jgi:predicted esterase
MLKRFGHVAVAAIETLLINAAIVGVGAAQNSPADAAVIFKESFEQGQKSPTGWRQQGNIPGVEYLWTDAEASDGKRSLGFQKTENRYFPIATWIRTATLRDDAANVEVSVMIKAAGATKAVVDLAYLNAQGRPLGHKWLAYIGAQEENDPPANHDWGRYASVVAIPRGAKKLALGLQMYGPGAVWFDQLEARYVNAPAGRDAAKPPLGRELGAKRQAEANSDAAESTSAESASNAESVSDAIEVTVKGDATGRYLLVPPAAEPAGLLVVLPGGDGSADFHPFVNNIGRTALEGEFAVAQPLATMWRPDQQIVWPTLRNRVPGMKFATEELVAKVIEDVAVKHKIDRRKIYLLAWSSGGPAAYAIALYKNSPITGSLIAMSVFRPKELPALTNAAKRSFYLFHSPQDEVCPYPMAQAAQASLERAGAQVTLVDYDGGHGWHGDIFGSIRAGIDWLEKQAPAQQAAPGN